MNNRIIKFRVWDPTNKKFKWDQNIYINSQFSDTILTQCPNDVVFYKNLIIQQFIGRQDKNKKDIYEGDIVQYDRGGENCNTYKDVVVWNEKYLGWSLAENYCSERVFRVSMEVVGNIFETPDLLKQL